MARERELRVTVLGEDRGGRKVLADLGDQADKAGDKTDGLGRRLQGLGGNVATMGAKMSVGLTAPLALVGKALFDASSDMNESLSKSNTIFAEQGAAIEKWASGAAKGFGQSKQQALDAAGGFGNMFTQLDIGREKAASMSTGMVELASDFASFHNADVTEVLEAQAAAFRGEYDAVQKFVPTINAATIKQKALEMGLAGSTKELTAQHKALATEALLLEGAGAAMGDFDRTADGAANKQRIISAQFKDTAATLGQALMPIAQQVLGVLASLAERFGNLSPTMQKVGLAIGGVLLVMGPLTTIIGGLVAAVGFLISPVGLVIVGIAALVAGLVLAYQHFEGFRNVVDAVGRFLVEVVWPAIQGFAGFIIEAFTQLLAVAQVVWGAISTVIETVVAMIAGFVRLGLALIQGDWSAAWDAIKDILSAAWDGIQATIGGAIDTVIGFVAGMPGRIARVAVGMWDGIKSAFRSAINWIIGAWNGLQFTLPSFAGLKVAGRTLIPGWQGPTLGTPDIPYLASGGIATSAGLAVVGERGPELAFLSRGAGVMPLPPANASTGSVTINLSVGTVVGHNGMSELAYQIRDEFLRIARRQPLGF